MDNSKDDARIALIGKLRELYADEMSNGFYPSTTALARKLKDTSECMAFDIIYGDAAIDLISPEFVHYALKVNRSIHYHYDELHDNAQNILLKEFEKDSYGMLMLEGTGTK